MAANTIAKKATPKMKTGYSLPRQTQTTLVSKEWGGKTSANNGKGKSKPQGPANGNIMAFFKKAEDINNRIFLQEKGTNPTIELDNTEEDAGWSDELTNLVTSSPGKDKERYNENEGCQKKRKLNEGLGIPAFASPPSGLVEAPTVQTLPNKIPEPPKLRKKSGPFVDDSDDDEEAEALILRRGTIKQELTEDSTCSKPLEESSHVDNAEIDIDRTPTRPKTEEASRFGQDEFDEAENLEDDDLLEGEEYDERRWMKEQRRLEMDMAGFEGDPNDFDAPSLFPEEQTGDDVLPTCPLCSGSLKGLSEQESLVHVNACLDGKPIPLPSPVEVKCDSTTTPVIDAKAFKRPARPPREAQANPFQLGEKTDAGPTSAFSKLMAGHAEDAAWATAAAANNAARGKPAFERTCPFYKIMPGFFIAVDAFRYGAVKGQNAYFLSHFHSDHYIGLTSSWSHGPVYCSKVTGNLVRQQLRVDPKWVVDLDFERKTEVPGTEGVHVTMISANHCPGSSLFLFEKESNKGPKLNLQRVLHCGDFRACQMHIEHPLLRPEVVDAVSGASRQQKLDVCYLDTTYLTPKYAFPPQQQVIKACADMCVSLNKARTDDTDGWEQINREHAGGMTKFVRKNSVKNTDEAPKPPDRGRLLVIVGTYSIGKERICVGIAQALGSLIYAPPNKQRICHALEDPELNALLTTDPRKAQVHMTPLFEIRADTLDDYLGDYADTFSRAVGFRPSGWNYRPPNSRFTDSPLVSTVLHSSNWKSVFTMKDLTPQRGSTGRASCFGVPYSEHSSFRELTMFCCALNIDKIIPTVNVGSAKSRERMKGWCEKWATEKKKNGLFKLGEEGWC